MKALAEHDGPYVFRNSYGRRLTSDSLRTTVRRCAAAVGVDASPRSFRQYVVTSLLESGFDLETVRLISGHRSRSIEAYVKRRSQRARDAAEAFAAANTLGAKIDLAP